MTTGAWEYCGRFSGMSQEPLPRPDLGWIDEAEAERRYRDQAAELTILPSIDPSTGIRPYFIVVTPGPRPGFTLIEQQPPGVRSAEAMWANTADGLFLASAVFYEWPAAEDIRSRSLAKWTRRTVMKNRQDGSGSLLIAEQGSRDVTTAKREFDPATLYRPVPDWGRWDTLREASARS